MSATRKVVEMPVTIGRNSIGSITLEPGVSLQAFAEQNAGRVASMLHVLMQVHQEIDGGFMTDMLEIANDMAYQVQQAVELMNMEGGAA